MSSCTTDAICSASPATNAVRRGGEIVGAWASSRAELLWKFRVAAIGLLFGAMVERSAFMRTNARLTMTSA